ncbi:MAG: arylsulfatase [Planctomycetota bacterium]
MPEAPAPATSRPPTAAWLRAFTAAPIRAGRMRRLLPIALQVFSLLLVLPSLSAQPNIVLIYADDMGYGDLAANHPVSKIPTPHLDRLASQGLRFTDGHSSSGICTPSRFALLTGQHHWRRFHGIVSSFGPSVFEPDDFTLPKMLQSRGYRTAAIGKWHLGWDWAALRRPGAPIPTKKVPAEPDHYDWDKPIPGGPLAQGFDEYFGDGTINFPPYGWIENDRFVEAPTVMMDTATFRPIPEGEWEFRPGPMVEGWDPYAVLPTVTDRAVDWLSRQNRDRPFFLYFSLPSPHAPIIPNEPYRGKSDAGAYGDFIVETDAMVGRVLQALEDHALTQNTIVIFTSDNGPELYAFERRREHDHWSSGPWRGLKRDLWEGGHRVPLLIAWPGVIERGRVSHETVSQVDLTATFAALVGYRLEHDEAIDSYNLMPLLKGEAHGSPLRVATVHNTRPNAFALRQGDWLYIDGPIGEHSRRPDWFREAWDDPRKASTPAMLFNLAEDPGQRDNRYAAHRDRAAAMKSLLEAYRGGRGCAPHASPEDPFASPTTR